MQDGVLDERLVAKHADELTGILLRRLPETFKDPARHDEDRTFPITARIVQILEPRIWDRDPPGALIAVMRQAIADLPDERFAGATITWRRLAETLAGLRHDVPPRADGLLHTYDSLYNVVYSSGDFIGSKSSLQRRIGEMRKRLARILLVRESETVERRSRLPIDAAEPTLIDRPIYTDAIRSHVDAGKLLVCLWGEPGTGKTILAGQAAKELGPRGPVVNLRAGDPDVLRDDIVDALITAGLQPTDWSDSYCRAMLRRTLAEQPQCSAVVVDNIDEEALIWQLVPTQPQVPILITMRTKPQSPDLATVELDDFSEAQACSFIRSHLSNAEDTEVLALARVLGCRPLALDHAVRFLQQTSTVTPRGLVSTLTTSVTDGLNLVANPADKARNLVRLYKIILASVIEDDPVRHLLDSFLAVAGKSGMEDRDLLSAFMQSDAGGSADLVRFGSGFRALELHGLLREAPHPGNRHSTLLIIHPLTYEILRDLRTPVPFQIEYAYLEFLASDEVGQLRDETFTSGTANAWLRKQILTIASRLNLPYGWKTLQVIDALTWVAVREELEGIDTDSQEIITAEYIVRYELHPQGMYKLDYRTGRREALEGEEGQQLRQIATAYRDKVNPFLQEVRERYSAPDDPPEAE